MDHHLRTLVVGMLHQLIRLLEYTIGMLSLEDYYEEDDHEALLIIM